MPSASQAGCHGFDPGLPLHCTSGREDDQSNLYRTVCDTTRCPEKDSENAWAFCASHGVPSPSRKRRVSPRFRRFVNVWRFVSYVPSPAKVTTPSFRLSSATSLASKSMENSTYTTEGSSVAYRAFERLSLCPSAKPFPLS